MFVKTLVISNFTKGTTGNTQSLKRNSLTLEVLQRRRKGKLSHLSPHDTSTQLKRPLPCSVSAERKNGGFPVPTERPHLFCKRQVSAHALLFRLIHYDLFHCISNCSYDLLSPNHAFDPFFWAHLLSSETFSLCPKVSHQQPAKIPYVLPFFHTALTWFFHKTWAIPIVLSNSTTRRA